MNSGSDRLDGGSLRVGLAVIYAADSRALAATIDAISLLPEQPAQTIVLEWQSPERTLPDIRQGAAFEHVKVPANGNIRQVALERLADCDIVILIREGIVLGSSAIRAERERFEAALNLRVSLRKSELVLDMGAFLQQADRTDPFTVLKRRGRRRSRLESRYFTPCVLSIATGRGETALFENFARRSEWAAARLFIDRIADKSTVTEKLSDEFGMIGSMPDNRESKRQGQNACEELYRFAAAFNSYDGLVNSDVRRLLIEQIHGVLRFSRPTARLRFIKGMLIAMKSQRMLRSRLKRDIGDLA